MYLLRNLWVRRTKVIELSEVKWSSFCCEFIHEKWWIIKTLFLKMVSLYNNSKCYSFNPTTSSVWFKSTLAVARLFSEGPFVLPMFYISSLYFFYALENVQNISFFCFVKARFHSHEWRSDQDDLLFWKRKAPLGALIFAL